MKLIENAKAIALKGYSPWLMLLAVLLSGLEVVLPLYEAAFPKGMFAGLSMAVTGGAYVARFIAQDGLHKKEEPNDEQQN